MIKIQLIILMLILFGFSCKNANIKDIQGTVRNEAGEPVPGAAVILTYWVPTRSNSLKPSSHVHNYHYDSTVSDASGKYKMKEREKMRWEYHLRVRHHDYHSTEYYLVYYDNPFDPAFRKPISYLTIQLKKNTTQSAKIKVQCNTFNYTRLNNQLIDSTLMNSAVIDADKDCKIKWTINDIIMDSVIVSLKRGEKHTQLIVYD